MPSSKPFTPNFFAQNSITLPHPLPQVLSLLGDNTGLERVTRLSGLCTGFKLLQLDQVSISAPLSDVSLLHEEAYKPGEQEPGTLVQRQHFELEETIPLLFGLFSSAVRLSGTLSWDEERKVVLYESEVGQGVRIWRLRTFEEVDGGSKVVVTEKIEGVCPAWLKWIVQSTTTVKHKAHVDAYDKLFQ